MFKGAIQRFFRAVRGARAALAATPPQKAVAALLAGLTIVLPCLVVVWPWWQARDTFGFHDWDVQTSHRYLAKMSLLEYGEFPSWNPYACGGFPGWGYVESGTSVVSPFLPFYLFADIRTAIRIEVLGMALAGALGAFLAAGRFTTSLGARGVVVALFAVNGRWGLQTASGHTWHLAYALLPWAIWCFEGARITKPMPFGQLVGLGVSFALLVYAGGIYPLPHTVLILGLWAVAMAIHDKSPRPIMILAIGGAVGVGLGAPKLLPLLATFDKAPRLIESKETLGLGAFWTLLTSKQQAFFDRPAEVRPYGWHEWGMYISTPGALALALGFVFVGGKRESILKLLGAICVVLGFGAFHEDAPWTLLHAHVPVFRSQHVPSRFLYPAALLLGLVLAAGLGRVVDRLGKRTRWADAGLALLALALALDVALVAQKPMKNAMVLRAPATVPRAEQFHFVEQPPFQYRPRDWAGPMYLAMLGNTGVINCYGTPPFDERGAVATDDRTHAYRGEVFVEPEGTARIEAWSPNSARVAVSGAPRGAKLVYNMNYDRGWAAVIEGPGPAPHAEVIPTDHRVSVPVPEGDSTVRLVYRTPGLRVGLVLLFGTLAALVAIAVRRARARVA